MSHNGHHRRSEFQFFWIILFKMNERFFLERDLFRFIAEFTCNHSSSFKIDGLIQSGHDAKSHQFLNYLARLYSYPFGQFGYQNRFVDLDATLDGLGSGKQRFLALNCHLSLTVPSILTGPEGLFVVKVRSVQDLLLSKGNFLLEELLMLF